MNARRRGKPRVDRAQRRQDESTELKDGKMVRRAQRWQGEHNDGKASRTTRNAYLRAVNRAMLESSPYTTHRFSPLASSFFRFLFMP